MTVKSQNQSDSIEMPDNVESVADLPLIWKYTKRSNKYNYELRRVSKSRNIAVLVSVNTDLRHMDDGSHPRRIVKVGEVEFEEVIHTDVDGVERTEENELDAIEYFGDWVSTDDVDDASIIDYTKSDDMLILDCENTHEMEFTVKIRFEETLESLVVEEAIEL